MKTKTFFISIMLMLCAGFAMAQAPMSQEEFLTAIEQIEEEKALIEDQMSEIRHIELSSLMDDYYMPIMRWFFGVLFALVGGLWAFLFFYTEEGWRKIKGVFPLLGGIFLVYLVGWGGEKGTHTWLELQRQEYVDAELQKKLAANEEYGELLLELESIEAKKMSLLQSFRTEKEVSLSEALALKKDIDSLKARNQQLLEMRQEELMNQKVLTPKSLRHRVLDGIFILFFCWAFMHEAREQMGIARVLYGIAALVTFIVALGVMSGMINGESEAMSHTEKTLFVRDKAQADMRKDAEFQKNQKQILLNEAVLLKFYSAKE